MHAAPLEKTAANIYSVSRLNSEAKQLLEGTYRCIWVEGEISNFAAPNSGHWYFSLKDENAQVRCALFRANQRHLMFTPKDGTHVLVRCRVSLYENRGEYQLIADDMEERGEGKLRRAYEALKKKLDLAGLFAAEQKKPLPSFPQIIGVITSPTGAAIRDILNVLARRFICTPVIIYPTQVQGEKAAAEIAAAIEIANRRAECDVLIVARGGGSLEDLWPFNEEIVARAIYASALPIISGVGHEVDFTIADFVADQRAPTPSAAAEIITPDCAEIKKLLQRQQQTLVRAILLKIAERKQRIEWTQKHLLQQHPKRRLQEKIQHLDFCELTLVQHQTRLLNKLQSQLKHLDYQLYKHLPHAIVHRMQNSLRLQQTQLANFILKKISTYQAQLAKGAAQLDAISPLATLSRGYAIASDAQGEVIRSVKQTSSGDKIHLRLAEGELDCKVV